MKASITCLLVAVAFVVTSFSQSAEAQNFRQLGTRRGALTGAIIGGIVGNQNNEAFAGVVVGGLVGGVAGRVVGNNLDQRYYGTQQPIYQQPIHHQPVYQQQYYSAPRQVYYQQQPAVYGGYGAPVYNYGGGHYGHNGHRHGW